MTNPLVSVIIPVYKVESYIHRCIDSILNQVYTNIEIILVDDGSPDNCPIICDNYSQRDPRIKVIHKSNGGLSEARNFGLAISSGEYISFVDSDDFVSPYYLEELINICIEHNCEISQSILVKWRKQNTPVYNKRGSIKIYDNYQIFDKRRLIIGSVGKLYHFSLFSDIKFPVGKIYEDDFTTWKMVFKAHRIAVTNSKLYYYFQSPNSIMRNNSNHVCVDFYEAYDERLNFFRFRNETYLFEKTNEFYCLTLMLTYIKCKKNPENNNDLNEMLSIFREHYKEVLHHKSVRYSTKGMFLLFMRFPDQASYIVNILRLRG